MILPSRDTCTARGQHRRQRPSFLGQLARSLHYWLAVALVVTLILHMVREALEHNNEVADLFGVLGFWFSTDFTENVDQLLRLYIGAPTSGWSAAHASKSKCNGPPFGRAAYYLLTR